ncbi:MAG: PhoH family protein [Bacteroidales bacterium]|jgi:phosphate starvation-inducible PhoH-like protein|nr:PhoH family protein [Bacteroidales bacterium]
MESRIDLESLNPVDFYGVNEQRLEHIRTMFPKIKLVARGNQIKILGEAAEVERFTVLLDKIKRHYATYNSLSDTEWDSLLNDNGTKATLAAGGGDVILFSTTGNPIRPRSETQMRMVKEFERNDLLFATGPAGTGKTFLAVALAVKALKSGAVRRIILCRPAVEAGEKIGFLPGDMKEKLDPYMQALYDALNEMIPQRRLEDMIEERIVQIAPLAFMRGRTLGDAVVILDEAQNATVAQLKMFLTRMGDNSKFIVTGDETQIDLPRHSDSGLVHALRILNGIRGISFVAFGKDDVVRHKLVKKIIDAYEVNA